MSFGPRLTILLGLVVLSGAGCRRLHAERTTFVDSPTSPRVSAANRPAPAPSTAGQASAVVSAAASASTTSVAQQPFERQAISCDGKQAEPCYLLATQAFGIDLFRLLATGNENLIISPPGLMAASAAIYLGAAGETARRFGHALHLEYLQPAQLVNGAAQRRWRWNQARQGVTLDLLQMVIVDRVVSVNPTWEHRVKQAFDARVETVDFSDHTDAAVKQVNDFAAQATGGRITDVLHPSIGTKATTRLVVESAVFFKGAWKYRFAKSWTRDQLFLTLAGNREKVRMMRQEAKLRYRPVQEDGASALELPYVGDRLGLVIVLPDDERGLPRLESKLSIEAFERWTPTREHDVDVWLPRVHTSSQVNLRSALERLGANDLFGLDANLSQIGQLPENTVLDQAEHQCTLEIGEQGTIATSITTYAAVELGDGHPPNRPVVFRVDHPFLFFIRDRQTGAVLFLGRVTRPGYEPAAEATAPGTAPEEPGLGW